MATEGAQEESVEERLARAEQVNAVLVIEMERLRLVEAEATDHRSAAVMVDALTASAEALRSFAADPFGGRDPRAGPAGSFTAPLRVPPIERFSGNREKTMEFVTAIEGRLRTTGQEDTPAGLEFVVGHFTGVAISWYRYYAAANPMAKTWAWVKPEFLQAFSLADEETKYQKLLTTTKQSGTVTEYVDAMLAICIRLPNIPENVKVTQMQLGSCKYLREKFATREGAKFASVHALAQYMLTLADAVDPAYLVPDADAVIAAVAGKPFGRNRPQTSFGGVCWNCGSTGHRSTECRAKPSPAGATHRKPGGNPPARGKAGFGKYTGSGKVHAVEAETVVDEVSDDELRTGNEEA